jgi:hypothetical protein
MHDTDLSDVVLPLTVIASASGRAFRKRSVRTARQQPWISTREME